MIPNIKNRKEVNIKSKKDFIKKYHKSKRNCSRKGRNWIEPRDKSVLLLHHKKFLLTYIFLKLFIRKKISRLIGEIQ